MNSPLRMTTLAAVTALTLVGCQSEDSAAPDEVAAGRTESVSQQPAADEISQQSTAPAEASMDLAAMIENADTARGKRLYIQCQACHSLEADEPHRVGPNLHGFFDRKVATADGFNYSPALQEADFEWAPDKLDEWLAKPSQFLPGNRMAFVGVNDPQDRANLIAYLQDATQ